MPIRVYPTFNSETKGNCAMSTGSHKDHIARVCRDFEEIFGGVPEAAFFAPGRVNLIGEHTDYNGGHVFPCAISLGTYAAAARRTDGRVRLHSMNRSFTGTMEFVLPPPASKRADADWTAYPLGVIHTLFATGHGFAGGLDIVYHGNLPGGAGLSSSASIEVLTGLICNDFFGLGLSMTELALLGQKAENEYVGVRCGIMDQFSVAMGRENCAILLDCNTLVHRYSPLALDGYHIVLTNSNKKHSLGSSKYNERRTQCEAALADLRTIRPDLPSLGALTGEEFDTLACHITDPVNRSRARHAVLENRRTLKAVEALEANDLASFGQLMNESHISQRDDYDVSCREMDILAELAWQVPGVLGSRLTGGGFGGCTVSLVPVSQIDAFRAHIAPAYTRESGLIPDFIVADVFGGARREEAV